ncbi:MAG TPA: YdcF family protein, partial [Rhodanobacteraceae bacterium]|nr:YdcF family protein [Rhodanobacteraceae bacterium]
MQRFVLSPLFIGIVLALVLWLGQRLPRWLRRLLAAGVIGCYLLSTQLGADTLLRYAVENRAAAPCPAPSPHAVVVLAGGVDEDARPGDYAALNQYSLRRLIGAVEFWRRQGANVPLVISGGSVWHGPAEAALMGVFAEKLGVPASRLRIESHSRTTWQNAHNLAALQPPLPRRVWLVTSAAHMPRALYSLREAGFQPCPIPVDYRAMPVHSWRALMPTVEALTKT